jgi:NitT/TauT family transport system ATP-binding protein
MIRWGQTRFSSQGADAAASAYRPDIYRAALGDVSLPSDADIRVEGADADDRFMDGHVFDPASIERYVEAFAVRRKTGELARRDHE